MQPCHNHKTSNALNKIIYNDHKNLEEKNVANENFITNAKFYLYKINFIFLCNYFFFYFGK